MDPDRDRAGETLLGKWHLDALLGAGGAAMVYAATHRNGSRGAVKMLCSTEPEMARRFVREGYIANRVHHPGVVGALDDDVAEDGTPFLVMELLEGRALDELALERGGRLPVIEVLALMHDVLDALEAAHARGIVHRDIKPENVFITHDRRVKVLDFGIAHMPEGNGHASSRTVAGCVMGTPSFMSPEQARARWELVGPASDVWAVGATMFTLLSGEFVHKGETVPEVLSETFTKPARSLRAVLPDAPDEVVAVVDRALELHIPERWGSAAEMRDAITDALAGLGAADASAARPFASTVRAPRSGFASSPDAATLALDAPSASSLPAITLPPRRPLASRRLRTGLGLGAAVVVISIALRSFVGSAQRPEASRARAAAQAPAAVVDPGEVCPEPTSLPAAAAPPPAETAVAATPAAPAPSSSAAKRGVGVVGVRTRKDLFDRRY